MELRASFLLEALLQGAKGSVVREEARGQRKVREGTGGDLPRSASKDGVLCQGARRDVPEDQGCPCVLVTCI